MKLLLSVLIIFGCSTSLSSAFSYACRAKWPKCGKKYENIVCERKGNCTPAEGCQDLPTKPEFLKFILHEHNRLRNIIASGKETKGYTGKAANMMALSYDKGLEYTAKCHVNRCKFEHDHCRGTSTFKKAGQNLFYTTDSEEGLKKAVIDWYSEINSMTPDVIDKYPKGRLDIGHFTQVIWAETTHIGCATAKSSSSGIDEYYITCNYAPQGNSVGKTVYKRGDGCTKCPAYTKCNVLFPSLCGDIDESQISATAPKDQYYSDDTTTAPPPTTAVAVMLNPLLTGSDPLNESSGFNGVGTIGGMNGSAGLNGIGMNGGMNGSAGFNGIGMIGGMNGSAGFGGIGMNGSAGFGGIGMNGSAGFNGIGSINGSIGLGGINGYNETNLNNGNTLIGGKRRRKHRKCTGSANLPSSIFVTFIYLSIISVWKVM